MADDTSSNIGRDAALADGAEPGPDAGGWAPGTPYGLGVPAGATTGDGVKLSGAEWPASGRRRRKVVIWAAAVLALAAAVSGLVYLEATDEAADDVVVRWHRSPADCRGAKTRPGSGDGGVFGSPAVVVVEGFRCTVRVDIFNRSERSVHVDHAVARMVGPRTGLIVKVEPVLHSQRIQEAEDLDPGDDGYDAYISVADGLDLDPGGDGSFNIHLVFNRRGCNNSGTVAVSGWPEVTFSILGREFTRPAANDLVFDSPGRTPGCREIER